jgi:hypothetical protein
MDPLQSILKALMYLMHLLMLEKLLQLVYFLVEFRGDTNATLYLLPVTKPHQRNLRLDRCLALSSMGIATVKYDTLNCPKQEKCRIVVLGNTNYHSWSKNLLLLWLCLNLSFFFFHL